MRRPPADRLRIAGWSAPAGAGAEGSTLLPVGLAEAARRAASEGAALLLVPALEEAGMPPQASDGPVPTALGDLAAAAGIGLVAGYLERCTGRVHDAALAIDSGGHALANYRATHLREGAGPFSPGHWLTLAPYPDLRLAILIGADIELPEPARCLALAGADLLVVLARDDAVAGWPVLAAARALENALPTVVVGADPDGPPLQAWDDRGLTVPVREIGPRCAMVAIDPVSAAGRRPALFASRRPRLYPALGSVDAG